MIVALISVLLLFVIFILFIKTSRFGRLPSGDRLKKIQSSTYYRAGAFQNLSVTPDLTDGATFWSVMLDFTFNGSRRAKPSRAIPSQKTDLLSLDPQENVLVWFGHSSYFIQLDGKKFLLDPVLSGNASPMNFTTKSFPGSDIYIAADFPPIDYLVISHDHWDHLDHKFISAIKDKVKAVVTGLGTGAHLERWGYKPSQIQEMSWHESFSMDNGFTFDSVPARHFSGRGFKRNQALWTSFVLTTPTQKIFLGGDSGYDTHFKEIGDKFGPFDLAILECGQYNKSWKHIHMMPEEVVMAAIDLKAKQLLPVHWGKFVLAPHDWDEPIIRVVNESVKRNLRVLHPMIGEKVVWQNKQEFSRWWEE